MALTRDPADSEPCRVSPAYRVKLDRDACWRAVVALASGQHGVLRRQDIHDRGISQSALSRHVMAGHLHQIHRGVYAVMPPNLLTRHARDLAAVFACARPTAALSHQSAAMNLALRVYSGRRIHVAVPTQSGRAVKGIVIHRSATLRPGDIVIANGIPTTKPARTLLDLAGVVTADALSKALSIAIESRVADLRELDEQLDRASTRPETRTLRSALATYTESFNLNELERRFDAIIGAAGLPEPRRQQWLDLGDGEPMIRPDFLWPSIKLIIETDGWGAHGHRSAFETDRRRDQRAAARGFQTVRITRNQVRDEAPRLQMMLAAVVASAAEAA
jgi:predicted transcriptional regulator of viral defense system